MVGNAVNGAAMGDLLAALRAVAEPTRLRLLVLCARGELTVSELAQILGQSQPRVSRHLKLLCEAGLLDRFRTMFVLKPNSFNVDVGVSVLRDPYSAKPYVLFYTTKRVGGGVQDFDAIKLMKMAVS